jgi:hypothetical protein
VARQQGGAAAALGAVALFAIAGAAQIEHRAAVLGTTQALSERDLLSGRHRPYEAGVDKRPPLGKLDHTCRVRLPVRRSHTKPRSPAKTTGVSFLSLPAGAYFLRRDAPWARMMIGVSFANPETAVSDERIQHESVTASERRQARVFPCRAGLAVDGLAGVAASSFLT